MMALFTSSVKTSVYPDRIASEVPTGTCMDLHAPFKKQNKINRIIELGMVRV